MGIAVFILILSLVAMIKPHIYWYLTIGSSFKNSEPSCIAIVGNRIVGTIMAIATSVIIIIFITNAIHANIWPRNFIENLTSNQVQRIVLVDDKFHEKSLPVENVETLSYIFEKVRMKKHKGIRESMTSYNTRIEFHFERGHEVTFYGNGDSFWVSTGIGVDDIYYYSFKSNEVRDWFTEHFGDTKDFKE